MCFSNALASVLIIFMIYETLQIQRWQCSLQTFLQRKVSIYFLIFFSLLPRDLSPKSWNRVGKRSKRKKNYSVLRKMELYFVDMCGWCSWSTYFLHHPSVEICWLINGFFLRLLFSSFWSFCTLYCLRKQNSTFYLFSF